VAIKTIFVTGIFLALLGLPFRATPAARAAPPQLGSRADSQVEKEMQERAVREANKKRQQEIRDSTEKLLQLAGELKDAVDKSNEHMLSLDVVRKADEVEKLAKKVKEKMKEAVGLPPPPGRVEPPPRTNLP